MVVRADGNNFIPELAAAATTIKVCPVGLPMTLKDSTAAIGAISKGVVSERKEFAQQAEHGLTLVGRIS